MLDAASRRQFIRWALVGVAVNAIGYIAFLGMVYAGLHHQLAATAVFSIAVLVAYVANRSWSFGHQGGVTRSFANYMVLNLLAWVLNVLVLFIFVDVMGFHHAPVQGIAILVIACLTFIGQRYWVFASSQIDTTLDSNL